MKFWVIFMIIQLVLKVCSEIDKQFVVDYFTFKKSPAVVVFMCTLTEDKLVLAKTFFKYNLRVSFGNLNNVSKILTSMRVKYSRIGILVDASCFDNEHITKALQQAAEYRLYGDLHDWLAIGNHSIDESIHFYDGEAFTLSTDFAVAIESELPQYTIYDVYKTEKDLPYDFYISKIGVWGISSGLVMYTTRGKIQRRSNQRGMPLRAIVYQTSYKPKDMKLEDYLQDFYKSGKLDGLSKFGYNIVSHFSDLFNFSLDIFEAGKWVEGDRLGPIVQGLINGTADITGTSVTMNLPRVKSVKFVYSAWPFSTIFMFKALPNRDMKINEVLRPFTNDVWYLSWLLMFIIIYILATVLKFEYNSGVFSNYSNSLIIVIGAVCQQGSSFVIRRISTRITYLSIMLFCYLIYNYYSASIVLARLSEPISKINDSLVEMSKLNMKFASEWIIYLNFFLKSTEYETKYFYDKIWLNIPKNDCYLEPEEGMDLVRKGGFAYHTHPGVGYTFINRLWDNREVCELTEVHLARPTLSSFAVTYNSSFIELSRIGFARLTEAGLKQRQVLRWTTKKPVCRKDVLTAASIDIFEFAPHLLLLGGGLIVTVLVYALEIFAAFYLRYKGGTEAVSGQRTISLEAVFQFVQNILHRMRRHSFLRFFDRYLAAKDDKTKDGYNTSITDSSGRNPSEITSRDESMANLAVK